MKDLNEKEIRLLLFLVRTRLKYESQRPRRLVKEGRDIQYEKVNELVVLRDKLEEIQLAS